MLTEFFAEAALSPASGGAASIAHGAQVFATAGCVHCHGAAGIGGGKGPDLKNVRRRLNAALMVHQIHDGGQSMPPFGDILTSQDITDVVTYLRSKRP